MNLEAFLTQLIAGTYRGSFYWLLASGLTLIFGVTKVINFAHAALFVTGGYLMYTFYMYTGSFIFSLIISSIFTGILGIFIEVTLIRRIYTIEHTYQLLLTFAITLCLNEVQKIIWGRYPKSVPIPSYFRDYISFGAISVSYYILFIISIGVVVFFVIYYLLNKTFWGLKVRAVWRDRYMSQVLSINPKTLYTLTFFIGTMLAGLGGSLITLLHPVSPGLGDALILQAFIVVI
ncbi:MAG: branched-chain amino acid ABC transporter permease, partial [Ignisphaera sp.]